MTSEQPKVEGVDEAQAKVAELASKMKSINNIDIEALKRMKMAQILEMQKKADALPTLTPEVKWAQNPDAISLSIMITQVARPNVTINGDTLEFCCSAVGASGERRNYEFELNFYDHVDRGFMVRPGQNCLQLIVRKDRESCTMWKKLTRGDKPQFLKIDTERWVDPDDVKFRTPEEMEKMRQEQLSERERTIEERYKQVMFAEDVKSREAENSRELTKRVYLFLFSFAMFLGFAFVFGKNVYGIVTGGKDFLAHAYKSSAQLINALHIFAFLEAIHTYVGLTSGKTLTSITQCAGRAIICLYLSQNSRAQSSEFVFGLWMAWSLSEIIRYPYYMSAIMKMRMPRLEWLRYTAFIVLYPIGCVCEMGVIEAVIAHLISPWTEILEAEPLEGSAEPPLEEGAEVPIPEPTIIEHPGGEKTNFFWVLRAHQCALPVIVLMIMYSMLKRRSKALAAGKKVDDSIAAQRAKNAERMDELQKKFVAKQLEEMKSAEEKKDE